jgi:outer membrane protein assembly factor BamB
LAVILCAATNGFLAAEDWPGFRGATGMGISSEAGLPVEWNADGKNVLWKTPLPATRRDATPDHNQSSPIVLGDRIVLTTALWPGKDMQKIPEQHVTCYRLSDGQELWDTPVPAGPWKLTDLRGGYAAPTPVADSQRVYVVFGSSVLAALDWDGKIMWRRELPDWQAFDVAIASSPILFRGQLLLLADRNQKKSTLTAFNPATGDPVWEQKRSQGAFTHTTPVLIDNGGQPQLLVTASNELQALDPTNGERLWWCKTPGDVTSPVFARGLVYTDSGRGGPGLLVEASGQGDVAATHIKWRLDQIPEGLSSPVIVGDYLYRLHNPGVLKCVDLRDGSEAYATRLAGVSVASSPIATADGRIYCASGGKSFVIKAGPKFELLATNDLGEACLASAAISGGKLFLKGQRHLFCIAAK